MKKLFTLLLTVGSFTGLFAQGGHDNGRDNDRYDQRSNDAVMNNRGKAYDRPAVYNYPSPSGRGNMDDKARQQEADRMNRDYDRRAADYRNDRSLSPYERNRRINEVERERKEKTGSFVKGAVVGGIAGVILGVLLSK